MAQALPSAKRAASASTTFSRRTPREPLTRTASPPSTTPEPRAAAAASASAKRWSEPFAQAGLARAVDDLRAERPDADDHVDPAAERAAALAVERGAGRAELEHVAEDRHVPPAGQERQRHHRGFERVGRGVVAVVEDDDTLGERAHLAAVARRREVQRGVGHRLGGDAERVRGAGGGQEVRDEVRPGEGEGDVHRPSADPQVEAHAGGGAAPALGRDVEPAVLPEPDDPAREALRDPHDPRVVAVEDRGAVRAQALEDLGLGLGDRVDRREALEVDGGDLRDHRHVGERHAGERADLAGRRHADLHDRRRVLGPQAQDRERHAEVVVEVALRAQHGAARLEDARRHVLRRGLADRARDGDERDRRAASHVAPEVGEGERRVGDADDRQAGGRLDLGADERRRRLLRRGVGEERVAVEAGAADRHEEGARVERPRVDRDRRDRGRVQGTRGRHDERAPGRGEDLGEGERRDRQGGHRCFPRPERISRATCRSSNGTVRSRRTW